MFIKLFKLAFRYVFDQSQFEEDILVTMEADRTGDNIAQSLIHQGPAGSRFKFGFLLCPRGTSERRLFIAKNFKLRC